MMGLTRTKYGIGCPATSAGATYSRAQGVEGAIAAVASAIHHATGKRIREAPITPDQLIV
ncbi:MAG TPA: hypothetical protein VHC72_01820 [Bryobacteraceae bacterium]|nr:hypothetical protein [Bryobacteraceae bacterium]